MERQIFAWGRSGSLTRQGEQWTECFWILGLLFAAFLLLGVNLGELPLQSGSEEILARVVHAWELSLAQSKLGEFFLAAEHLGLSPPPLLLRLITLAYQIGGENPLMTRLPGAILTALSVPLLYGVGREIFYARLPALWGALFYLTSLPIIAYGRLATVEGVGLCGEILTIWCALRSRRDQRWSLGVGIGLGFVLLTRGLLGLGVAAIILLFFAWDTPRLLRSSLGWLGFLLGFSLGLPWYLWQGELTLTRSPLIPFAQVGTTPSFLAGLWQLLILIFPWFLFWSSGYCFAWSNRHWSWSKLILVWSGVNLGLIVPIVLAYPQASLPLYPAFALAAAAKLEEANNLPSDCAYPRFWWVGLWIAALGFMGGGMATIVLGSSYNPLGLLFMAVALTFGMSAVLMVQRDRQFIVIMFWGMYICLWLLVSTPVWGWLL